MRSALGRSFAVFLATWIGVSSSGCATMISGTRQKIDIGAAPPGTEVTIHRWSGEAVAGPVRAPASDVKVPRPRYRHPYVVVASKEGYCPQYWVPATSHTPGMALDVILLVGLLGYISLFIDGSNGALFELDEGPFTNVVLKEEPCGS